MTNDGGPAFSGFELRDTKFTVMDPDGTTREESAGYKSMQYVTGNLTLRDYFAAHATEADISAFMFSRDMAEMSPEEYMTARCAARYRHADAMLAERERKSS